MARALLTLTPFVDSDTLTGADRRTYRAYAKAQRYKDFENISVEFTPPPEPASENEPAERFAGGAGRQTVGGGRGSGVVEPGVDNVLDEEQQCRGDRDGDQRADDPEQGRAE